VVAYRSRMVLSDRCQSVNRMGARYLALDFSFRALVLLSQRRRLMAHRYACRTCGRHRTCRIRNCHGNCDPECLDCSYGCTECGQRHGHHATTCSVIRVGGPTLTVAYPPPDIHRPDVPLLKTHPQAPIHDCWRPYGRPCGPCNAQEAGWRTPLTQLILTNGKLRKRKKSIDRKG
jgi:hypothetical protein